MYNKYYLNLSENWFIDKDPENRGLEMEWNKKISEDAVPTPVPAIIQEVLPEYHGVAFYWCKLIPEINCGKNDRCILRFKAVDYKATVWLNGEILGEHEGGETPFEFDVTEKLNFEKENLIAVKVVNPTDYDIDGLNVVNAANRNKTTYKQAGACLNSGGIWDEVELFVVPNIYIEDKFVFGNINTGEITAKIDIKNCSGTEEKATLSLNIYGKTDSTHKITEISTGISANAGSSTSEISVAVPDFRLWDINDPFLYRVEIVLTSAYGEYRESINFGFREFKVVDGYFYLNGRKIFLKCSHSGNAFPIGQNYPVVKEHVRQDMIMAKSYGFNMVRAIAGTFRTEQIEVCDEIGLLLYEECLAAWQLGEGHHMLKDRDNADLDQEKMFRRFDVCTLEMIKRDRNHPSVVIWCLLNEMNITNPISLYAENFLPELREIDPTRLVLLHSGRWDARVNVASASNPYSDTWNAPMGMDFRDVPKEEFMDNGILVNGIGDYHYYPDYPMTQKDLNTFRNYAKDGLPAFVSESGIGPLFNVTEESKHFKQYGFRADLEDFSWLEAQSKGLEADWERFGLKKVYPYSEMMLKESQRLSALDRRLIFDAIRSNPKHNGYSLTGLLDHGMCGEGLWSLWRRFKPEVYDTVCDGWEPLRFCLFVKHHVYSGEEFEIEAVLANECVLKPGKYTADFAITGENGTVEMFTEEFEIKDDAFAVPVMKKTISLDVPTGKYSLIAYLREGSPLGNKLDFYVKNINDLPKTKAKIYACGIYEEALNDLRSLGVTVEEFDGQTDGIVLVGKTPDEGCISKAKIAADNGAKVVFLRPEAFIVNNGFGKLSELEIADDLDVFTTRDWLYHKECIAANSEVFNGLGLGICDSVKYGQSYPKWSYMTSRTPDDIICPAFYVGSPHVSGAYGSAHVLAGFTSGKGMIYLSSFRLEVNLGKHPAADMIMVNLINYLSK